MGKSNFAVFVDLENVGAKESMLRYIIEKVKIRGDILLGKVYGYTDRYSDLKPVSYTHLDVYKRQTSYSSARFASSSSR